MTDHDDALADGSEAERRTPRASAFAGIGRPMGRPDPGAESGDAGAVPGPTASAVKGWVRAALLLDVDATVLVSELACTEPGCPPVETVIAVLDGVSLKVTIHRPLVALDRAIVDAAFGSPVAH